MAIQKKLWERSYKLNEIPQWECSNCKNGKLVFSKDRMKTFEAGISKKERENPDCEPYWEFGHFITSLVCSNCKETVLLQGEYHTEEEYDYEDIFIYKKYSPQYFSNSPEIFSLGDNVPKEIYEEIKNSFKLYFHDIPSCGNRIRTSIELILNEKKIPRFSKNKKNKRVIISLHKRIEKFATINKPIADKLLAIKWIGNVGSHSNKLDNIDLLNAYEILEDVIDNLYEKKSKKIEQMVKKINKRKKPLLSNKK